MLLKIPVYPYPPSGFKPLGGLDDGVARCLMQLANPWGCTKPKNPISYRNRVFWFG
jgi:hypothetical protein